MLKRRAVYLVLFVFCIWLALTTRSHQSFFHPIIVEYGGDVIWAAAFLFLMRAVLVKTHAWKLAIICFVAGVLNEFSQLLYFDWIVAVRQTYIGRLMLGVGFLWSDIVCYAIGVMAAFAIILFIDKHTGNRSFKTA